MADRVVKTVEIDVLAKDGDAKAKLDAISAKADKLREEHPELTIRIDTAEASAKMIVFREELKDATRSVKAEIKPEVNKKDLVKAESELSLLERFNGGGSGNGFLSGLDNLPFGGLPVFAAIAAALGPVVVELTGVVSGLAAAGAGVTAFGILALPTFDKIKNAYTSVAAAQLAYNNAAQLEKRDPTKANATAAALALTKEKIAFDNLSPATRKALSGIDQLKSSYERLAKAFEPDVLKVFDAGLQIANELIPDLKPLADGVIPTIDKITGKLATFFQTREKINTGSYLQKGGKLIDQTQLTGFGQFLQELKPLEGPALGAIAAGFGRIATNLGRLLTSMSAKDVVHALNIAFDILSGTIRFTDSFVVHAIARWEQMVRVFRDVKNAITLFRTDARRDLDAWADDVRRAFDAVVGAVEHAIGNIEHAFDNVEHAGDNFAHAISVTATKVVGFFKSLPGRIVSALGNLGHLLVSAGASIIHGLLGGLQSAGGGVLSWVEGFASKISSVFSAVLHMASPSRVFEEHGKNIVRGLVLGIDGSSGLAIASSQRLARSVGAAGGGGSAGAGGGRIVLEIAGSDQQILTAFAHALRVRGGSPALIGLKT